ncbi:MAG: glycosyltransferase family 4 protein [Eubacteriales bacterium]|nr:glycosyltransferase family 4 protein [Eubacteriales bacterium]
MKQKKDILFACQFFYPEYISSAQLPFDTAKALTAAGYSVDVLCGYPREYLDGGSIPLRENVEGIDIHRLKYIQLDRSGFLGRIVNYFSFTFMVLLNLPKLRHYRSIVVYSNPPILPWIVSWAKALFGTKLVFVAYDLYPEVATVTKTLGEGNPICRLMNHINRCICRRADRIVALSREMKTYILNHRDYPEKNVRVIPNWYADHGVVTGNRENNPFREVTKGRFTVSYFGNMGTMQDMKTILEAVRELQHEDVFFLFAGHGNKMEALKETVQAEGIENIAIYPFLHGQDFRDALAISDCALVTLVQGATGLCVPSKTYSYMMQGIPLLAVMDEGDIVSDIERGAGRWVRNGEGKLLAQHIREMKENPELVRQMRTVCRKLYENNYTEKICTQQYVTLFRELLEQA